MSTVVTITKPNPDQIIAMWGDLRAGETGDTVEIGSFSDKSVHIEITGTAGTTVLQGSNSGTDYQTLTDQNDNNLSFTTNKIEAIAQNTRLLRPSHSGGDGTTSIKITVFAKRP